MPIPRDELISLANESNEESNLLDFKSEYAPERKAAFWAEVVKDIVAFANTKGGIILFGLNDDGSESGVDCTRLFSLDSAALTDQVRKYTDFNFIGLSVVRILRRGKIYPATLIDRISAPMVFTKVGTYEIGEGRQKNAFSVGNIYFRHGSKSEPCTRDDLAETIQVELQRTRSEWLRNIRKVVEAEPGATVVITRTSNDASAGPIRITTDPDAPLARLPRLSDGYPYRQVDVIKFVNSRLSSPSHINTHDIQAIKLFEGISAEETPQYMHKPHEHASPQYTEEFMSLIISRANADLDYLSKCRAHWKATKYP